MGNRRRFISNLFKRHRKTTPPALGAAAPPTNPGVEGSSTTVDKKATKDSGPETVEFTNSFPDGILELYNCPDPTVDICFVHGLSGNRSTTWTAGGQSLPWPKSLLPLKLPTARILSYGYDAYPVRKSVASSNRLIDHASNLLNDITTDRAISNSSSRPLIFVAHSLGGLVCKKAVLLSRNHPEPHLRDVFSSTKAIMFMGTPHRGSWMAHWASIPASAFGLIKSTNQSLLRVLQTENELLSSIQIDFWSMIRELRESGRRLEITCIFEELGLHTFGKVVSHESATLEGYNSMSIHANHSDMVKFTSMEDNGFVRVLGELVRWESQVSVGQSLGIVFRTMRLIHETFEDAQSDVMQMTDISLHENSFHNSLILLGSSRRQLEEACINLTAGLPVGQTHHLLYRQGEWNALDLQNMLLSRFSGSFGEFSTLIQRIRRQLNTMGRKLRVQAGGEACIDIIALAADSASFIQHWKEIQIGPHRKNYERLLRKICTDVSHLRVLVVGDDEPTEEDEEGLTPSDTTAKYWLEIQSHTKRLLAKITFATSQSCCTHSHQVRVRLRTPTVQEVARSSPQFIYSFELKQDEDAHLLTKDIWKDFTVISQLISTNDTAHAAPVSGKKKARFNIPYLETRGLGSSRLCTSEVEIYDLCRTIRRDGKEGNCFGFLPYGHWQYHMHDMGHHSRQLTTLKQLLPCHNGKHLQLRQRRAIALSLATGVLQLYDTPWLQDNWTMDNVYVDMEDQTCLYVKMELDGANGPKIMSSANTGNNPLVPNRCLFSLAVAFLELTYGRPLSSYWVDEDGDDSLTLQRIALRLTKSIGEHEHGAFKSAVYRCMNPVWSGEFDFDFGNEGFRRRYIKDVLLPLQQEYESFI